MLKFYRASFAAVPNKQGPRSNFEIGGGGGGGHISDSMLGGTR